jgi:alkanesulfonate monooxygenase SsuD/methylene tetrahydromethanopterin reductase-like flavin-dependent oxidoreductase (luciferase family)
MAAETEEIELGMLITNLAWRDPVQVARFAMTVDQISKGRFVLGVGCGQVDDQIMAGNAIHQMANSERVDRLAEGVQVLDRLLRGDESGFHGTFTSYDAAAMAPGSVQQPRVPIVVAGNGRRSMQIAVEHADTWNTWVDNGDVDAFHTQTIERVARLDQLLAEAGRAPDSLARSLLVFHDALDPWSDDSTIPRLVERFRPLGFTEFVFYPPGPEQLRDFLRIGTSVLPDLQE